MKRSYRSRDASVLLISNSTLYQRGYLDHVAEQLREVLASARRIAFVPYANEITVFDSTGVALQDAVTAVLVLRRATELGLGTQFAFSM